MSKMLFNLYGASSVAVLMAFSLAATAFSQQPPGKATAPSDKKTAAASEQTITSVPSIRVAKGDVVRTFVFTGELKAARSREIKGPQISSGFNSMVTFLALEGTAVQKGERIAEFDSSSLDNQRGEAERRLDEAKLKIEMTIANLDAQRADLLNDVQQAEGSVKITQLYAKIDKSLLPANTYQKYQLDLEKANLNLKKARERLSNHDVSRAAQIRLVEVEREQAEIDLKKIDADIALLQIDAPQDGIVIYGDNWGSNRKWQVGDSLFPGQTLITLPDLSSMQAIGYVYDTELRYLSPGMTCDISLDAHPGQTWRGRLVSLTSVASRKGFATQQKVFRATIQPDAADTKLMKPGMTVRLEFPVSLASNVLVVPRDYLGLDAKGGYYVLKAAEGKSATAQTVQTGVFSETIVQIVSGINEGDSILEVQSVREKR